mgnify:CR=1 FL=1
MNIGLINDWLSFCDSVSDTINADGYGLLNIIKSNTDDSFNENNDQMKNKKITIKHNNRDGYYLLISKKSYNVMMENIKNQNIKEI